MTDIADVRITIKVKHMYAVLFTVVGITVTAVYGWLSLKAEAKSAVEAAAQAKYEVVLVKNEVTHIRCLIEQGNNYQIYKILPKKECE